MIRQSNLRKGESHAGGSPTVLRIGVALVTTNAVVSAVDLSDVEVENIVRRSYQYVAMYNVNNKFALQSRRLEHL